MRLWKQVVEMSFLQGSALAFAQSFGRSSEKSRYHIERSQQRRSGHLPCRFLLAKVLQAFITGESLGTDSGHAGWMDVRITHGNTGNGSNSMILSISASLYLILKWINTINKYFNDQTSCFEMMSHVWIVSTETDNETQFISSPVTYMFPLLVKHTSHDIVLDQVPFPPSS